MHEVGEVGEGRTRGTRCQGGLEGVTIEQRLIGGYFGYFRYCGHINQYGRYGRYGARLSNI